MPLIPYPDVPNVPGVPALARAAITSAEDHLVSLIDPKTSSLPPVRVHKTPPWGIFDKNGIELLLPDSVVDFEYRGEAHVPIFPIEKGGFASYNKVQMPFDVRMTVSCGGRGGHGKMDKAEFLTTIQDMLTGLDPVTIVAADHLLWDCQLIHVDYRRTGRQGVSLILAQLWFQEIREINTGKTVAAKPDGAGVQKNGQVAPTNPTSQQAAAVGAIQ